MKLRYSLYTILALSALASCKDNETPEPGPGAEAEKPDWYYAGGELGTSYITTSAALEQPTRSVENSGLLASFKRGEQLFEKNYVSNAEGIRSGLGPIYVRSSCIHCHPGYGHGKSQPDGTFKSTEIGNGYLLVVYNPATQGYVNWLAGMPQTHGVDPFAAPLDENRINIRWHEYTDAWGNKFPDGESYSLRYPEVSFPPEAVYAYRRGALTREQMGEYEVRLESTIGIYGTGLIDAISDEDLLAQYLKEETDGYMPNGLNPAVFAAGNWTGQYTSKEEASDGKKYPLRYTYALSRGPLQDAAGANAYWNITNVTRSDRRYHYKDAGGYYVAAAAADPDVQQGFPAYINRIDPDHTHPEWHTGDLRHDIAEYMNSRTLPAEATDQNYIDLMVWHRGLAVPAVRGIDNEDVQRGREIFAEIGCDYCHRPSWTTGSDPIRDPAGYFTADHPERALPQYPNQKIWPYTDMVQHKLHMVNDIRNGWCRTTPLWARGLHQRVTGSPYADRLHDCRARTTMEAIMWHGDARSDAYRTVEKFRQLSKADRDAVIAFLDAI